MVSRVIKGLKVFKGLVVCAFYLVVVAIELLSKGVKDGQKAYK